MVWRTNIHTIPLGFWPPWQQIVFVFVIAFLFVCFCLYVCIFISFNHVHCSTAAACELPDLPTWPTYLNTHLPTWPTYLVTFETLITILTTENLNSWQSLLPVNLEWQWTAFAILAMFYSDLTRNIYALLSRSGICRKYTLFWSPFLLRFDSDKWYSTQTWLRYLRKKMAAKASGLVYSYSN